VSVCRAACFCLCALLLATAGCGSATPAAHQPSQTPLQAAGYSRLSTHEEVVEFVAALGAGWPHVTAGTLGRSLEGREIPYLAISRGEFGADREARTVVLIYAEQHGTEPAGREAVLALALALARGDHEDLLAHVDVLLVPQVNPDGGSRHERRNAADVDLNRAHLVLDAPEVVALRELFHRWEPEVAVDLHEYYPWSEPWLARGWLRRWDLQIGLPNNLNVDAAIRALAETEFLPGAIAALEASGYTAHNYIVGTPEGVRYSTTDIDDGRHGLAILQTLSLIYEGRRERTPAGRIEHRTAAQYTGLAYLLAFMAEHGVRIRDTVHEARRRLAAGEIEQIHLLMGRAAGPAPLEILVDRVVAGEGEGDDAWQVVEVIPARIDAYRPRVTSELAVPLPAAYLVPAAQQDVIALLRQHRVEMCELAGGEVLGVERLAIDGFTERELEEPMSIAEVSSRADEITAAAGDVLIPTAQLRGLMVATALEPASMHGLLVYPAYAGLAAIGPYPVSRVPAGAASFHSACGRND